MDSLTLLVSEHLKLISQHSHRSNTAKPASFPWSYTRFWVASVFLCSCTAYFPVSEPQHPFMKGNIMAFLRFCDPSLQTVIFIEKGLNSDVTSVFPPNRNSSINLETWNTLPPWIPHTLIVALYRPSPGAAGIKQGTVAKIKRHLKIVLQASFLLGIPMNYPWITGNSTASAPAQTTRHRSHCTYGTSYLGHTAQRGSNNLSVVLRHKDLFLFLVL